MQNISIWTWATYTLPCTANGFSGPGESRNPAHTFVGLASSIFVQPHDSLKNLHSLLSSGFWTSDTLRMSPRGTADFSPVLERAEWCQALVNLEVPWYLNILPTSTVTSKSQACQHCIKRGRSLCDRKGKRDRWSDGMRRPPASSLREGNAFDVL